MCFPLWALPLSSAQLGSHSPTAVVKQWARVIPGSGQREVECKGHVWWEGLVLVVSMRVRAISRSAAGVLK